MRTITETKCIFYVYNGTTNSIPITKIWRVYLFVGCAIPLCGRTFLIAPFAFDLNVNEVCIIVRTPTNCEYVKDFCCTRENFNGSKSNSQRQLQQISLWNVEVSKSLSNVFSTSIVQQQISTGPAKRHTKIPAAI